jgi:antitoxin StbD
METVYVDRWVSMTDFKQNPARVLRDAGAHPVAVLNHNKPAFYMLEPKLFEAMLEKLADLDLAELVASRLALKDRAIEVDIDEV